MQMSVVVNKSISRRKALGGMAAATAATVALPGLARAIDGGGDVKVFRGRYVFEGDRIIDGYMVSPRNAARLDTVVLLHGARRARLPRRLRPRGAYARAGKMVIVPDMAGDLSRHELRSPDGTRTRGHQGVRERSAGRPARNGKVEMSPPENLGSSRI